MPIIPTPTKSSPQTGKTSPLATRITRLGELLGKVCPIPSEWLTDTYSGSSKTDKIEPVACDNYEQLVHSWHRALHWTEGLDSALLCMLASIASTMQVGSQLWFKVMGPASCGKSTLCEAVTIARKYVVAKSTTRGFHSGYDDGGGEDTSLASKLAGMTLVTKDGDTLLSSPNLQQILSEARDIYDTVSRTSYRNKASKDYTGLRMTWLLCGTASLRSIDDSELGERFLDCVIMDGIDDELEDEILSRVAKKAISNMAIEYDGSATKQYGPEMIEAMQLTGGYVEWLRDNAKEKFEEVRWPQWAIKRCVVLGKFVAYMRARPSTRQEDTNEREFGARLVEQHVRLAQSLAVVLNLPSVTEEVMELVTKVALDTGRGPVLKMAHQMYRSFEGLELRAITLCVSLSDAKIQRLLRFLVHIGAIKQNLKKNKNGATTRRKKYQLTRVVRRLYKDVVGTNNNYEEEEL